MSDFFIRYQNVAVHARRTSKLSSSYEYRVMYIEHDSHFEFIRKMHPYANCVKIDLQEQLFGKNLKRYLPKKIRESVCELADIKPLIRDERIERLFES